MVTKPKTIVIDRDSELSRILKEADDGPLLLDSLGVRYRVERVERPNIIAPKTTDDIWVGYDPVALGEALAEAAGSWADVDTEALKEEIYRSRELRRANLTKGPDDGC